MIEARPTRTYRRFSAEDDSVIISEIKQSPTNLKNAFENASEKTSRNFKAIEARYYNNIRKGKTVVTCGSAMGLSSNIKNTLSKDGKIDLPELQPHLVVLRQMLDLPAKELDLILKLFKIK
jgi:hypothetical protein